MPDATQGNCNSRSLPRTGLHSAVPHTCNTHTTSRVLFFSQYNRSTCIFLLITAAPAAGFPAVSYIRQFTHWIRVWGLGTQWVCFNQMQLEMRFLMNLGTVYDAKSEKKETTERTEVPETLGLLRWTQEPKPCAGNLPETGNSFCATKLLCLD